MWTLWHTNLQVCCYFLLDPQIQKRLKAISPSNHPPYHQFGTSPVFAETKSIDEQLFVAVAGNGGNLLESSHTHTQSQSGISACVCAWKVNKINVLCLRAKKVRGFFWRKASGRGRGKDTPKIGYTLCIHIKVSYCRRNASPKYPNIRRRTEYNTVFWKSQEGFWSLSISYKM